MSDGFAPTMPHGEIHEVFKNLFQVTGSIRMKPFFLFSRNMTIVRDGESLTILNAVRLDDSGLEQLDTLGKVEHVIKLGGHHGLDDAFYVDRYGATYYVLDGDKPSGGITKHETITEDSELPIPGASMFLFKTSKTPEGLLRLDREGGVLVACDSLQNWAGPDQYFNLASKIVMKLMGFFAPANIGPGWRKGDEPKAEDFERLRSLTFEHVLCGHGKPVLGDAKQKYAPAIKKFFGV